MSRIGLAFSSFFRLLFGKKLHPDAAAYLPEQKALPAAKGDQPAGKGDQPAGKPTGKGDQPAGKGDRPAGKGAAGDQPGTKGDQPGAGKPDKPAEPAPARKVDSTALHRDGALALLGLLQREGRLVDFLRESLDDYSDADIGAAARDVHRGCKKIIDQCFTFEAVMLGAEDDKVSVPKGFDPAEIRLIGEARGQPPFGGTLRHHGWRATRTQLPTLSEGVDRAVVAPAEVEVGD